MTRAFREAIHTSIRDHQNTAQADISASRAELQRLSRRFVILERHVRNQMQRAGVFQELGDLPQSADQELARLLTVPGVSGIEVRGQVVNVLTHPIHIPWQSWRYALGRYRIVLDLGGDLRVESIDRLGPKPAWDHPHVQDGLPCLGNAREGVLKLIARYELALATQVMTGFLETYQPDGAYCAIEGWPRAHVDG